jgi:hypothetical protein
MGATVGCCHRSCKGNFHFACARKRDAVFTRKSEVFCQTCVPKVSGLGVAEHTHTLEHTQTGPSSMAVMVAHTDGDASQAHLSFTSYMASIFLARERVLESTLWSQANYTTHPTNHMPTHPLSHPPTHSPPTHSPPTRHSSPLPTTHPLPRSRTSHQTSSSLKTILCAAKCRLSNPKTESEKTRNRTRRSKS